MTMPLAQQALLWGLGCFAFLVVTWLSMSRSKWREELGDTGDLDTHLDLSHPFDDEPRRVSKHPALGVGYRQGPVMHKHPDERPAPRSRAPYYPSQRKVAEHHAQVILTPRHLEHVNILRRRDGKPPMNAAGFRTAVARQATAAEPRVVTSTNDWTAYLIAYVVLSSEHQQSRVACEHTITVSPDAPFNGQGGAFAGAGATSSFDAPADAGSVGGFATAAALAAGSALAGADPGPPEPQSAPEPDRTPSYSAPDPAPSYSAPEPSYSAPDTGGGTD